MTSINNTIQFGINVKFKKLLTTLLLLASTIFVNAKEIKICSDSNLWYPFTFEKQKIAKGLHIDIMSKAIKELGYNVTIEPMAWKRCLKYAEIGKVDAVISASYKDSRAKYMHYPPDSKSKKVSDWRLTQVKYVVIGLKDSFYEFNGNLKTLPSPIFAPFGYSIVEDLKKAGLEIKTAKNSIATFNRLLLNKTGVVVTIPEIVKVLNKQERFKNKFKISKKSIKSKSYFMPISKKSLLTKDDRIRIWNKIKQVRNNEKIMKEFLTKY